MRKTAVFPLPV